MHPVALCTIDTPPPEPIDIDSSSDDDEQATIEASRIRRIFRPKNMPIIDKSHFVLIKVIGTNKYGKEFLVRKIGGADAGKLYTMKIYNKISIVTDMKVVIQMKIERQVYEDIGVNPFLQTLHYAFTCDTKLYLVVDFAPGGKLSTLLSRFGCLSEDRIRFYVAEIILALEALHQRAIIYHDVRLKNILIDAQGHIMLTGFEKCKQLRKSQAGSYSSPAIDWWSVGIITYQLLTTTRPCNFHQEEKATETNLDAKMPKRVKHCMCSRMPPSASSEIKDFIYKLLVKNPARRLGIGDVDGHQLKSHCFFENVDWNLMALRKIAPPFVPEISSREDSLTSHYEDEFTSLPVIDSPAEAPARSGELFDCYYHVDQNRLTHEMIAKDQIWMKADETKFSKWDINMSRFFQEYKFDVDAPSLSYNSCSVYRKCVNRKNLEEYAVRMLSHIKDRALQFWSVCDNPYIVTLHEVYSDNICSYTVTEILSGGELASKIRGIALVEGVARRLLSQLTSAVHYLHSHRIVHRDLKAANIFLTTNRLYEAQVRIVDLAHAQLISDNTDATSCCMSSSSSNANSEIKDYGYHCDIWSLGAIYYQMLCGRALLRNMRSAPVYTYIDQIATGNHSMKGPMWDNVSIASKAIITGLLIADPSFQFTMEELNLIMPMILHNTR